MARTKRGRSLQSLLKEKSRTLFCAACGQPLGKREPRVEVRDEAGTAVGAFTHKRHKCMERANVQGGEGDKC